MSASYLMTMAAIKRILLIIILIAGCAGVRAQGITNARDGRGNLVERGAATRSYPAVPMANGAIRPTAPQSYVVIAHGRTAVIRPRHR
jgi:hypothetical protein